jgi:hypothetical protein
MAFPKQLSASLATGSTGYIRPDREDITASCHRARLLVLSHFWHATEDEHTPHPHRGNRRKSPYRRGRQSVRDQVRAAGSPLRKPYLASTPCHSTGAAPNRSSLLQAWKWLRPRTQHIPVKCNGRRHIEHLQQRRHPANFNAHATSSKIRCQVSGVRPQENRHAEVWFDLSLS